MTARYSSSRSNSDVWTFLRLFAVTRLRGFMRSFLHVGLGQTKTGKRPQKLAHSLVTTGWLPWPHQAAARLEVGRIV